MSIMHILRGGSTLRRAQLPRTHRIGPSAVSRTLSTITSAAAEETEDVVRHTRSIDEFGDNGSSKKRYWNGTGLKPSEFVGRKYFLRLTGLPKTAIHADVWRMLADSQVLGCLNVYLDYFRLSPLGAAWLSFGSLSEQQAAKAILRRAVMSSLPIAVEGIEGTPFRSVRMRGTEGRENALQRGVGVNVVMLGNGPDAGIRERGTGVVLFGLPGKLVPENLYRNVIHGFTLKGVMSDSVIKLESSRTLTSRFFIRLDCKAEAHRLVRSSHMNTYRPTEYGDKYVMRARVVY